MLPNDKWPAFVTTGAVDVRSTRREDPLVSDGDWAMESLKRSLASVALDRRTDDGGKLVNVGRPLLLVPDTISLPALES